MPRYINADRLYPTNFEIYTYAGDYKTALKAVYEKIDNAPAEDVAPVVHAKWIKYSDGIWECSHCGAYITKDMNDVLPQYYCRGCGAKMGEE